VNVEIERLTMANEMNIYTAYVQENGFGGIDMDRLGRAFEQLTLSMGLTGNVTPEGVVDLQYLPAAEERQF
jgi:NitT/TauT family transport system substrate-binding protein